VSYTYFLLNTELTASLTRYGTNYQLHNSRTFIEDIYLKSKLGDP